LEVDTPSSVNRSEDAAVEQQAHHDLVTVLTQQPQDIRPRRFLQDANIVVRELSHDAGDDIQGGLTNRWATEAMSEQVFRFLVAGLSKKRLYGEVDHLHTDVSQLKTRAPAHTIAYHDPTSDWGELGPVSVLTRIDRDWDWVKAR
jgi:hypothetical protein